MQRARKTKVNSDLEKGSFVCYSCGTVYDVRKKNFPKLRSPTYKGNGGFTHVCTNCVITFFEVHQERYHDAKKALQRTCEWLDIYWSDMVYEMISKPRGASTNVSPIIDYIQKSNLRQVSGDSYDDTIEESDEAGATIVKISDPAVEKRIPQRAFDLFGQGFTESAYLFMLKAYDAYVQPIGKSVTQGQLKSARFLSMLEYRAVESIRTGTNDAATLSNSFNKALKDSGFDVVAKKDDIATEPYGVWLAEIEKYTPAEYVLDHDIHKDVDDLGSYFERFVKRPIQNLLGKGGYIKDPELDIGEDEVAADAGGDDDGDSTE